MCLATPPTFRPGGASASIADFSTVPSIIEQRPNSHRIREVTERHVLLPISSSTCDEEDWDEDPAPAAGGAETIDPILTMRGSEDDDDTGRTDGGDATQSSSSMADDPNAEGITICGVSCCRCRLRWHEMNLFDLCLHVQSSISTFTSLSNFQVPLCDDYLCVTTGNTSNNTKRRGRRSKQHTNLDTIGEWRRQTSFSVTYPAQCLSTNCGEIPSGRLGSIAEEEEQEGGDGFRPLLSVYNLFACPRSGTPSKDEDGVIAFRKCYSQIRQSNNVDRERYALADDIYDDEESIVVFSKPNAIKDDGTAKTEQTEEDDLSADQGAAQHITGEQGPSFLDNFCANFCGVFPLNGFLGKRKCSGSSVVSLSDETMAEDGGIIVVRNGAAREIEFGEEISDTDEILGRETSDRSSGKRIEKSVKKVGDEVVHKAEDAGLLTLNGIVHVVKAMASTLTQGAVDADNKGEDEEDTKRTAEAREHADMVRGALNEISGRSVEGIGPDDLYPSQASF